MKFLVTGSAGFIGYHIARMILENFKRSSVVGIDNLNSYYSIKLKKKRISILDQSKFFKFKKLDLINRDELNKFFNKENFDYVFHFAAQAGVRFSLDNLEKYAGSNILVFFNLLNSLKNLQTLYYIFYLNFLLFLYIVGLVLIDNIVLLLYLFLHF